MTNIKAVIFDLDDTLIHSRINYKKMKSSIINFLINVGVQPSLLSEDMLNFEILRAAIEDLRKKETPENVIRKINNEVNAIMNKVELESLNDAKLRKGALEVLYDLKKRDIKIGIITNGCKDYAISIVRKFSIERYIDAIIARDEISNSKPDPEHLLTMLKILQVKTKEAIFVGDHWIDALCARNAGVRFILLKDKKEGRLSKTANCVRFEIIEDLRDLLSFL